MEKRKFIFGLLTLVLAISLPLQSQAANGKEKFGLGDLDISRIEGRKIVDKDIEKRKTERVKELARRLNIPSHELSDFFENLSKSGKLKTQISRTSWETLLREISITPRSATSTYIENQDILTGMLQSYIRVKKSSLAGELEIKPQDLLSIHKNWTHKQKENFSRVLRETVQIASSNRALTVDQAWKAALKKQGYLDEYLRNCKG